MILWILIGVLAAVAAGSLVAPFLKARALEGAPQEAPSATAEGVARTLRAQMDALAAEVAAGTVEASQADGLRAEVARRLLAESAAPPATPERPVRSTPAWAGALIAGVVALAAIVLYAGVGRPDLTGTVAAPAARSDADFAQLAGQLQAKMNQHPGDPQGWRLLGWSFIRLGRYGEAADAYGRAAALEPASAEDRSARGEALTRAAGGLVTAPALTAFREALARDGADPRARFYLALAQDQAGDHAAALSAWIALLKAAPPQAPWVADVRAAVERIAAHDGEHIGGRLPGDTRGVDVGGVKARDAAAGAGQQALIEGMVDRLAARLAADPRDAGGWVKLMRARMVLGQTEEARAAWRRGLAAFADSPPRQASLNAAAHALAVPGA